MPTGQVLRWHWRAMTQPIARSEAVPKPNSSAPKSAPTVMSREDVRSACALREGAKIVDQLGEIFNAVNIVMRWRRNERSAGRGVADARDVFGDFASGE